MKRVLIVQELWSGHRLSYVAALARRAASLGNEVHLLVRRDAVTSSEWRTHLQALASLLHVHFTDEFSPNVIREWEESLSASRIVVPDGDSLLPSLLSNRVRPTSTWVILSMRTRAQGVGVKPWRFLKTGLKAGLRAAVRRLCGVTVLELTSAVNSRPRRFEVRDPIRLTANPALLASKKIEWNLSEAGFWFGVVGALDERKNLPLIVDALSRLRGADVGLLLAGRPTARVRDDLPDWSRILGDAQIRLRVIDRVLTDDELDAAVAAVDAVVIAHSNEGPSGILGKAAAAGTRVFAAGAQTLRRDVRSLPGAGLWTPLEPDSIVEGIVQCMSMDAPRPASVGTEKEFADRFFGRAD
jgi:hypothetical protein